MNISSAILHVVPARLDEACTVLAGMPGVEIHARSPEGKVVVTLDGNPVAEAPLIALQDVPEGSFFSRLIDHILMLFHKLIG